MRHDAHFVEELTRRSGRHIGSMIPLEMIEPNADQPRTNLGNIEELAASIREKGVLEPILVRSVGPNRYQIISGERRFRAATMAGLDEIPAIELDVDDKEQLEIALIENIQRKDLTRVRRSGRLPRAAAEVRLHAREDLAGDRQVAHDHHRDAVDQRDPRPHPRRCAARPASRTSRSSCRSRAPATKQAMEEVVRRFGAGELTRDEVRKQTAKPEPKKAGRPKNFTWQVKDKSLPFSVNLSFRKANVEKSEIAEALRELLRADRERMIVGDAALARRLEVVSGARRRGEAFARAGGEVLDVAGGKASLLHASTHRSRRPSASESASR